MASVRFVVDNALIAKVTEYVRAYMANYDSSHDFAHIQRVLALAHRIQPTIPATHRAVVTLSALLHDVGDKKYLKPGEDASRLIQDLLISFGADESLASTVQTICSAVSYSSEVKDPARVKALVAQLPELGVVQDADRLDAIGAVGIGRCFTFSGAKGRTLGDSIEHFGDKLVKLEGMMKTDLGRELAVERTKRIRLMQQWWAEETGEPAP